MGITGIRTEVAVWNGFKFEDIELRRFDMPAGQSKANLAYQVSALSKRLCPLANVRLRYEAFCQSQGGAVHARKEGPTFVFFPKIAVPFNLSSST